MIIGNFARSYFSVAVDGFSSRSTFSNQSRNFLIIFVVFFTISRMVINNHHYIHTDETTCSAEGTRNLAFPVWSDRRTKNAPNATGGKNHVRIHRFCDEYSADAAAAPDGDVIFVCPSIIIIFRTNKRQSTPEYLIK